jgi:hypothetical protein
MQLEAMAIELPRCDGHPNRVPFCGVLTLVDVPSNGAPAGARGHRVMLTRAATERALPSLLGMGLDYAPTLDRHDARRKIGVITEANVTADKVEVAGYLYGRDFPEIVRELRAGGRRVLGMSYEIADARIAEARAPVWTVTDFTFTGAAVLRRDKAAYHQTWIHLTESGQ